MKRFIIVFMAAMVSGGSRAELPAGLYAAFDTSMGSFTCRLDYAEAPLTCANFIGLAEGTQSWIDPDTGVVRNDPFYDGLIFHRVIDGFVIQGGCPLGTGTSGPGYAFPDEFVPSSAHYENAGTLVMANSGPDSNGSQFFISVVPYPGLNPSLYMVFGDVVDGIGVVTNIGKVATTGDRPDMDVVINQISIQRIGAEAEAFDISTQPLPEVSPLALTLTNAPSGLQVVAGLTNQCLISIHSSPDLSDWELASTKYWATGTDHWNIDVSQSVEKEFFRGARVFYPQAHTNLPKTIEGHALSLSTSVGSIELLLQSGGGGTCTYNGGAPGIIYSWAWTEAPYYDLYVESSNLVPIRYSFSYESSTNGLCNGHYYSSGWQPFTGIFTDNLSP